MVKEMVLYYNPAQTPYSAKLKGVLVRMGIRIKNISPDQVTEQVGYLAGMPGFEQKSTAQGVSVQDVSGQQGTHGQMIPDQFLPTIEEEMLVMKNFTSRRIDELLVNLRKAGVPKIALKAIITEQNSRWTFYRLYEELKAEHKAMTAEAVASAPTALSED